MPISRRDGDKFIKESKMDFGCEQTNSESSYSNYAHISLFSEELSIATVKEYEIAERIGKKHGLKVVNQDFGKGEGAHPEYKTVYTGVYKSIKKLRKAPEEISAAIAELVKEFDKQNKTNS